jgi:hypothetical protein
MTDISLITSLYRGEAHLPAYGQHIKRVLSHLQREGISAEILVIANDPTPEERTLLADLPIRLIETERETLYASWNRGLKVMQADIFGVWNVDDIRDETALVQAYHLIKNGYTLVDAPMSVHTHIVRQTQMGTFIQKDQHIRAAYIQDTHLFTRKHCMNPFALMHRRLLDEVGFFDPHFRVVGDLEWSGRVQPVAKIAVLPEAGGIFNLHGGNLSSTGSTRQMIEENIVFLRRQQWDEVRPTPEPTAMREAWDTWGNPQQIAVPEKIAAMLWSDEALQAWYEWQEAKAMRQAGLDVWISRAKRLMDRLGLTEFLKSQMSKAKR